MSLPKAVIPFPIQGTKGIPGVDTYYFLNIEILFSESRPNRTKRLKEQLFLNSVFLAASEPHLPRRSVQFPRAACWPVPE